MTIKDIYDKILPAASMGIKALTYDGKELTVSAPLEPNLNDKGTAFAGSIYSSLVLSGWALVTMLLRDRNIDVDVVIATSSMDYIAPVAGDLCATATVVDESDLEPFYTRIDIKGRGKLTITSGLVSNGTKCAVFTGTYFARVL